MCHELILAGETAARVLAASRRGELELERTDLRVIAPEACAHSAEDVREADLSPILASGALDNDPLHIFVTAPRLRAGLRGITHHLMPPELPEGSLLRVAPGILCPSWEFLFVRGCAEARTLSDAIMLGTEVCGTYAHQSVSHRDQPIETGLPRVSSTGELAAYLARQRACAVQGRRARPCAGF